MARDRASRPEARSLRLFVAIEIPDDAQAAIDEAVAPLRERFPKARWVPRENRHVTLKFFGQTWPRLRGWVEDQVGVVAARTPAFETSVAAIGAFPGGRRARVLWSGLDDDAGAMSALATALDEALAREFRPESRAFTAHCTVARSDPPLHLEDGDLDVEPRPVRFSVHRVVLFRSELRRPAPRYEALARFPLAES
jgi:RNA 2',3'-cyclic 3'-phosphodiesterase